jgi:hypothetical protein
MRSASALRANGEHVCSDLSGDLINAGSYIFRRGILPIASPRNVLNYSAGHVMYSLSPTRETPVTACQTTQQINLSLWVIFVLL